MSNREVLICYSCCCLIGRRAADCHMCVVNHGRRGEGGTPSVSRSGPGATARPRPTVHYTTCSLQSSCTLYRSLLYKDGRNREDCRTTRCLRRLGEPCSLLVISPFRFVIYCFVPIAEHTHRKRKKKCQDLIEHCCRKKSGLN